MPNAGMLSLTRVSLPSEEGTLKKVFIDFYLKDNAIIWPRLSFMCHICSTADVRLSRRKNHGCVSDLRYVPPALRAGSYRLYQVLDLCWRSPESGDLCANEGNRKRRFDPMLVCEGSRPQRGANRLFHFPLICTMSRQIPARTSANQGPEKGDLMQVDTACELFLTAGE